MNICTQNGKREELIQAAVICVSCDLPAGHKTCGFLGHSATLGCSKCFKKFPGKVGEKDYSGFNRSLWPKRSNQQHRNDIKKSKNV